MANRIHHKGKYQTVEYNAGGTITPGMLLTLGSAGTVTAHATEGGRAEALFAQEDALQGKTISQNYTSGNPVSCILPMKGSSVNVLVEDGQDVSIGNELISAGNGKFKVASDLESGETLSQVICIALEANDLTGSNSSDTISAARIV